LQPQDWSLRVTDAYWTHDVEGEITVDLDGSQGHHLKYYLPATKEEYESYLASQIKPLVDEIRALEEKRGNGVTLDKNEYIGDRTRDLEQEISKIKSKNTPPNEQ